jgi:hypothetical protein
MELKEFIKTVLKDVTEAVSESQKETPRGRLIAPMSKGFKYHTYKCSKYALKPQGNQHQFPCWLDN